MEPPFPSDTEPGRETETVVTALYRTLSPSQRREICFDWNYCDPQRGLLRAFISNHWQITRPCIRSAFFTRAQQDLIHDAFRNLFDPAWYPRFKQQLEHDTHGHPWGTDQSIGIFGDPENGPFQFVMSGRHFTWRAGTDAEARAAFGGPILYGHQATGYYEKPHHPGNAFWQQALSMSQLAGMLDEQQLKHAVVDSLPPETAIGFRNERPGIPVTALTAGQRRELEDTLAVLVEPLRAVDRARVMQCLARQGGLDQCHVMFSREGRMSAPHWDNWRIEGPSFVWHFRGFPHVHVWVHVAEDTSVEANARRGTFLFANQDPLR
ncbi:MAG TPA: DUF3500 domain-containing protein [Usitatibacter sp.]|nr:DUF3500 domain-containing protein [Usitatibacter sp.]